jgi:hypothetical protein
MFTAKAAIIVRSVGITLPFTRGGPSDRRERDPASGETACSTTAGS